MEVGAQLQAPNGALLVGAIAGAASVSWPTIDGAVDDAQPAKRVRTEAGAVAAVPAAQLTAVGPQVKDKQDPARTVRSSLARLLACLRAVPHSRASQCDGATY